MSTPRLDTARCAMCSAKVRAPLQLRKVSSIPTQARIPRPSRCSPSSCAQTISLQVVGQRVDDLVLVDDRLPGRELPVQQSMCGCAERFRHEGEDLGDRRSTGEESAGRSRASSRNDSQATLEVRLSFTLWLPFGHRPDTCAWESETTVHNKQNNLVTGGGKRP